MKPGTLRRFKNFLGLKQSLASELKDLCKIYDDYAQSRGKTLNSQEVIKNYLADKEEFEYRDEILPILLVLKEEFQKKPNLNASSDNPQLRALKVILSLIHCDTNKHSNLSIALDGKRDPKIEFLNQLQEFAQEYLTTQSFSLPEIDNALYKFFTNLAGIKYIENFSKESSIVFPLKHLLTIYAVYNPEFNKISKKLKSELFQVKSAIENLLELENKQDFPYREEILAIVKKLNEELQKNPDITISATNPYFKALDLILMVISNITESENKFAQKTLEIKILEGLRKFAEEYLTGPSHSLPSIDAVIFDLFSKLAESNYNKNFTSPQFSSIYGEQSQPVPKFLQYHWLGDDLFPEYVSNMVHTITHFLTGSRVDGRIQGKVEIWAENPMLIMRALMRSEYEGVIPADKISIVNDLTANYPHPIKIINLSSPTVQAQFRATAAEMIKKGLEILKEKYPSIYGKYYLKEDVAHSEKFGLNITYFFDRVFLDSIGHKKVKNLAAITDSRRLIALWQQGGVYVDTDLIADGPFQAKTNSVSLAHHGDRNNFQAFWRAILQNSLEGNNCIIAAQPEQPLLAAMLAKMVIHYHHLYQYKKEDYTDDIVQQGLDRMKEKENKKNEDNIDKPVKEKHTADNNAPKKYKNMLETRDGKRYRLTREDLTQTLSIGGPTQFSKTAELIDQSRTNYLPDFQSYIGAFETENRSVFVGPFGNNAAPLPLIGPHNTYNKINVKCDNTWVPKDIKLAVTNETASPSPAQPRHQTVECPW